MSLDKSSKIYIAGHRGLVGSALQRKFHAGGFSHLLVRTSSELDLRKQTDVEAFFQKERPEVVILAAAKVGGILANSTYKAEFIYDNLAIATHVIHAAYLSGVKTLINLGSSCIYPKLAPQPLKEEALLTGPLEATNEPYAIAKIAALKLCRYYNEQYGTRFFSLMPTNLFGPNDNFNLETGHVLPSMLRKFHLGKFLRTKASDALVADCRRFALGFGLEPQGSFSACADQLRSIGVTADEIILWGTGEPRREFLHVDDLASASMFVLNSDAMDPGELINVGTGKDLSIRELAELIRSIVGYEGSVTFSKKYPDGTPRKLLDVSKIEKLGWKPSISLEEGIRATYDWYVRAQ